jgi:glycerate dehydrogenase
VAHDTPDHSPIALSDRSQPAMTEHLVFLDRSTLQATVRRPAFEHTWVEYAATAPGQMLERLHDATIVLTNKVPLRADVIAQLPHLKMIAVAATGYDVIDVAACRERGIVVCNIRNYAVNTVPEHVFALTLALRRSLLEYRADVERGRWQRAEQFCFFDHPIRDLHGSTMGIFGGGALGQGTAHLARAFGMRVLYAAINPGKTAGAERTPIDRVLAESDVISLHCPILINTARGGLVDEQALVTALTEGWIAGAGFDVLTTEPPRDGNPLLELRLPNFILTPHVAWASGDAMQILADQLIDNVELFIQGTPQHLVT